MENLHVLHIDVHLGGHQHAYTNLHHSYHCVQLLLSGDPSDIWHELPPCPRLWPYAKRWRRRRRRVFYITAHAKSGPLMAAVSCAWDSFVCVIIIQMWFCRLGLITSHTFSLSLSLSIEISFVKAASSKVLVMQILTCRFGLVAINWNQQIDGPNSCSLRTWCIFRDTIGSCQLA